MDNQFTHRGVMVCKCSFAMPDQKWPLSKGVNHLNSRCKWSCCDQPWINDRCTKEVSLRPTGGAYSDPLLAGGGSSSNNNNSSYSSANSSYSSASSNSNAGARNITMPVYYDSANLEPNRPRPAMAAAAPSINRLNAPTGPAVPQMPPPPQNRGLAVPNAAIAPRGVPIPDSPGSRTPPMPGQPGYYEEYEDEEPAAGCNDNFSNPLCFFGPATVEEKDEEFRNRLLTATMTESDFRKLVALNVGLYLKMLNLAPTVKRNADMVNSWILSGCTLWIRVAKGRDVPFVQLDAAASADFLSEFDRDSRGLYTQESALKKAAPDGELSEQDFMDWYVICKYTDAIIPPEDSGYPVFKTEHTSAMAQVLRPTRQIYDTSVLRRTPRGQTFDQVIQLGVDNPESTVGCIAGDEDAYATFPEFFVNVVEKLGIQRSSGRSGQVVAPVGLDPRGMLNWVGHSGKYDLNASHVRGTEDLSMFTGQYILAFSIQGCRNVRGYRFPAFCNRAERRAVEKMLRSAISADGQTFNGRYYSGNELTDTIMPKKVGPGAGYFNRDWPVNRGYFMDGPGTTHIMVNAEDHVCVAVSSPPQSVDVRGTFARYAQVMQALEGALRRENAAYFVSDDTFGYHTSNPRNMGTAMTANVKLNLPFLMKKNPAVILERIGLDFLSDPSVSAQTGVCELGFKCRVGFTEAEQLQTLVDGIKTLVSMEGCLQRGDVTGCSDMIRALPAGFVGPQIAADPASSRSNLGSSGVFRPEQLDQDDCPVFTRAHTSCLARTLDANMYRELCGKTRMAEGWSIEQATRSGVECPDTRVGLLLGGEASYEAFARLVSPMIADLHGGFNTASMVQPPVDVNFKALLDFLPRMETLDQSYIEQAVVTGYRNIYGYPLLPACDRKTRRAVEYILRTAFQRRAKELGGKYYPLISLTQQEAEGLENDAMCLLPPDAPEATPLNPSIETFFDYPDGRGVYQNREKQVFAWVNDTEHLVCLARSMGNVTSGMGAGRNARSQVDVATMIRDWAKTVATVEQVIEPSGFCFIHSERLGFVTADPALIGTSMKLHVIMRLTKLKLTQEKADALGRDLNLQFKPAYESNVMGATCPEVPTPDLWEVSNAIVLGYTEVDILQNFLYSLNTVSNQERNVQAVRLPEPVVRAAPPPMPRPAPAPVVVDPFALTDEELQYIRDNTFAGPGERKVSRTRMPNGSIEKYAAKLGIYSKMALVGSWMLKKMGGVGGNITTSKRFMWIDHLTRSLHWAHTDNKYASHKAFNLTEVVRIVRPPSKIANGVLVKSNPIDNNMRLYLQNGTYQDIDLPLGISKEDREDWITVLLDVCGFQSKEDAAMGSRSNNTWYNRPSTATYTTTGPTTNTVMFRDDTQLTQRAAAAPAMSARPTMQSRSQSAPDVYPYQYDRFANAAPPAYIPPPPGTPISRPQVQMQMPAPVQQPTQPAFPAQQQTYVPQMQIQRPVMAAGNFHATGSNF